MKKQCQVGIIFSCDQAALRTLLSVSPSVRHTFLTMYLSSYHPQIFRSYYHWQMWCSCKRSRSKVKVTEVMTPFSRFRTVTPVWIHIWRWNDAQILVLLRRGVLLFFKVIFQDHTAKKSSILTQIGRFRTVAPVWLHQWLWNLCTKLEAAYERCPIGFQGHLSSFKITRDKKLPILTRIERCRAVTQVWLHRWILNNAQSLM